MKREFYQPAGNTELAAGLGFLRDHPAYAHLMPPKKTLWVDWFLLRAISIEIAKRRTPKCELALLTGTVVREFVPDVNKATRELGMAYRDAMMEIFRRRKGFQKALRKSAGQKPPRNPVLDQDGYLRLI